MTTKNGKTTKGVVLDNETIQEIQKEARNQARSFSSQVSFILIQWVKKRMEEAPKKQVHSVS